MSKLCTEGFTPVTTALRVGRIIITILHTRKSRLQSLRKGHPFGEATELDSAPLWGRWEWPLGGALATDTRY